MDMTQTEAMAGKARLQAAVDAGVGQATAGLEKTQAQIKEQMGRAMKKAEEMASFNHGTLEAMMKAGQIWSAGVQDLSRQMAASAQATISDTFSTMKALSGLRSVKEAMDMQANYARGVVEKTMAETGRLTDASFKLAEQTMAPLTERVTMAVETLTRPA